MFCDATRDRNSNKPPIFITGFAGGVKLGSFLAVRALTLGVKLGTAGGVKLGSFLAVRALTLGVKLGTAGGVKLGTAGEENCGPIGIVGPSYFLLPDAAPERRKHPRFFT